MFPRRSLQQGGVLIILVLILIVGVASVMLSGISPMIRNRSAVQMDTVTQQALFNAKEGLLTWASMRGIATNTDVPPGLLPYPDRSAPSESPRDYNGISDCPPIGGSIASNLLRLGKLPVLGEEGPCRSLDGDTSPHQALKILDSRDSARETIWYAASKNLLDDRSTGSLTPLPDIRPSVATLTTDWLVVCDQRGNLLSDRVAFVVIAPGSPLQGQARPNPPAVIPAPAASNYLDAFPLPASGNALCRNAAESNYDGNNVFIANNGLSTSFNDQLLFVTANELFSRVTVAAAKAVAVQLQRYYATYGVFPYVATFSISPASTGDCDAGVGTGRLPVTCSGWSPGIPFMPGANANEDTGWYAQTEYSVDALRKVAMIKFDNCDIVFTLDSSFNFTYMPKKCVP